MNNSNNNTYLTKLVDNLKSKIKKIEQHAKNVHSGEMITYRIHMPISNNKNSKKYVGLLFNNNYDISSDITDSKDSISFIKLKKNNNIINYSITLKIDSIKDLKDIKEGKDNICTFSLGIRDGTNKIKIIKGSKVQYDILKDIVDGNIIVNNTILYEALDNHELCLISSLSKKASLINKKSIIKILNL
jgi:hypothetical protein